MDWKVSGINKLINIKKKEIERLCELRNSTIDSGILHGFHHGDIPSTGVMWNDLVDWYAEEKNIDENREIVFIKRLCECLDTSLSTGSQK